MNLYVLYNEDESRYNFGDECYGFWGADGYVPLEEAQVFTKEELENIRFFPLGCKVIRLPSRKTLE